MRRSLLALISAGLLAISIAAPASAITGNYVEDFEHPFVGLIAFYDADGNFSHRCSGSLIAPRVFLTAGHCTADDSTADPTDVMASARIWFRQDAGAEFNGTIDPRTGYPDSCINDPNYPDAQEQCVTADEMYNYGFDNFAGFPNTRDVGVVILDKAVNLPEYGTLAPAGTMDKLKAKGNTTLTVSGYGITEAADKHGPAVSFRERLMAVSTVTNTESSWNDGFNLQTQGNGSGRGGTCSGDSGGPVFLGGTSSNLIVAVTSFGKNARCIGTDYAYRTDRAEVIAWIDEVAGRLWNP